MIIDARALLLTGPVGIGKSTVAEAVGELLAAAAVPHAVIDLDELHRRWPAPADDPFDLAMELRNLGALAGNYLGAGARRLVLAGVVESRADRRRYAEVLGTELTVCLLTADAAAIDRRLARRHGAEDTDGLRWHLARARELDGIFRRAGVEDFAVAADGPVTDVAKAVLAAAGWP
ncbi:AAA family ATPase [Amycolatopsis samaneae]|uniref:AAA family ATPase n=1 Tax=Amycolatopsis samaneae TaxID=664691 RepID=A0ABW5GVD1_9PSEU